MEQSHPVEAKHAGWDQLMRGSVSRRGDDPFLNLEEWRAVAGKVPEQGRGMLSPGI